MAGALILFDLISTCSSIAAHARAGKIAFGINHEMRDFSHGRKKNLDLVVCTPASGASTGETLLQQSDKWTLQLSEEERSLLEDLPAIRRAPVGNVLIALEAKACMTAHQKALPRLYDELNSSQLTIHGAAESAIAVGFVCVNAAGEYLSPDRNKRPLDSQPKWSRNPQPKSTEITVAKVKEIPRRSGLSGQGYDSLGIVVIDFRNDGSRVQLVGPPLAPEEYNYTQMIDRICGTYITRFRDL